MEYVDQNLDTTSLSTPHPFLTNYQHNHLQANEYAKFDFNLKKQEFIAEGVEIRPIVGGNMTKQPFFKKYVGESYMLQDVDFVHENSFYIPNNPDLSEEDINRLINLVKTKWII